MEKMIYKKIIAVLAALLVVSVAVIIYQYRELQVEPKVEIKESVVIKYVEKKDSMPDAKEEKKVGTIKIPVKSNSKYKIELISKNSEKLSENSRDSLLLSEKVSDISDNLSDSTGYIEVDRVQKVYYDSCYTAYVSGYDPRLDSIFVRQKEITKTITETRTYTQNKLSQWNIGLCVGYGYTINSKCFEPFVGFAVTYNPFGSKRKKKGN